MTDTQNKRLINRSSDIIGPMLLGLLGIPVEECRQATIVFKIKTTVV